MKMSVKEAATKWNVSVRRVQDYCAKGKIEGVVRFGSNWMIPSTAQKPIDCRKKHSELFSETLLRRSPFLDMTDLFSESGSADKVIKEIGYNKQTQALFSAEISYRRGEIDKVYNSVMDLLSNKDDLYSVISGGFLLSLVAIWKGDLYLWNKARRYLVEAPCKDDNDKDIIELTIAAMDSSVRKADDFPQWFIRGCFDYLPYDAHPAARVYYVKQLLISAQELAMGNIEIEGVQGIALIKTIPYIVEPLISQTVVEKIVLVEIHLRILCSIAYHQSGDNKSASKHLDKAIKLCLADGFYGLLVEYRRQLGIFLDERIALQSIEAARIVKQMYKQFHIGWTNLHNKVMQKSISSNLSLREREVARLVAYGFSNLQIAKRLYISEASVKTIIRSIKNKTGAEKKKQFIYFV